MHCQIVLTFPSSKVTCSDGIFCNGMERFVNGACAPAAYLPCDDGVQCTTDLCSEYAGGKCEWVLASNCDSCVEGAIPF